MPLPPHDPGPSTDLIGAMSFHGANAAVRLGVFDALLRHRRRGREGDRRRRGGPDPPARPADDDRLSPRHDDVFTATAMWTDSGYATPLRLWGAIIGEFWRDLYERPGDRPSPGRLLPLALRPPSTTWPSSTSSSRAWRAGWPKRSWS